METLQRTILYSSHVAAGGRMVPFAGWEMPVQYSGVIPEVRAVREGCGVFDVSHMARFAAHGDKCRRGFERAGLLGLEKHAQQFGGLLAFIERKRRRHRRHYGLSHSSRITGIS